MDKNTDNLLRNLQIAAPCRASWDNMSGDEKVRFCSECKLNVYNISAMSSSEAQDFLGQNQQKARLCVRFYRRVDGTILTDNCPVGLRTLRNTCRKVAAGITAVFSMLLSFHISQARASDPPKSMSQLLLDKLLNKRIDPGNQGWANGGLRLNMIDPSVDTKAPVLPIRVEPLPFKQLREPVKADPTPRVREYRWPGPRIREYGWTSSPDRKAPQRTFTQKRIQFDQPVKNVAFPAITSWQEAIKALTSDDQHVRENGARSLEVISRQASFHLPDEGLAKILPLATSDQNPEIRKQLVMVLGRVGPRSQAIENALTRLLSQDKEAEVRTNAAYALGYLGMQQYHANAKQTAIALATSLREDRSEHVRAMAATALGLMGAKAESAVQLLRSAVKDNYDTVRFRAIEALGHIGSRAFQAVPELIDTLNGPDERIGMGSAHWYAASALGSIGKAAAPAVPALINVLKHADDPGVKSTIAVALGHIGSSSSLAVTQLAALLHDDDWSVREHAAEALGRIGSPALSALTDLEKLAKGESTAPGREYWAKHAAAEAITKIRGITSK